METVRQFDLSLDNTEGEDVPRSLLPPAGESPSLFANTTPSSLAASGSTAGGGTTISQGDIWSYVFIILKIRKSYVPALPKNRRTGKLFAPSSSQ
jgi:hypothetical protein